jgi:enterochelin esterase-like enzyme
MKTAMIAAAWLVSSGLVWRSVAASPPSTSQPAVALSAKEDGNFVIGPEYTDAPELEVRPGVPRGSVKTFVMESADSKMYPGISKKTSGVVPYKRKVGVYIPSQYVAGTPVPFIVCQDANYQRELPRILDNMINDHRLPIMVAVFIGNGGGDAQGSERGLEYDTVSGKYAEFVQTEVLPKIAADYKITFSTNPDARATMGSSSGGAAAFTMAWFHPEWYHRVLTYSGTYVNQQSPKNSDSPHGAWEYHEHLIPQADAKPLRVWMEVGEKDNRFGDAEGTLHNWVMANDRMAAALKAKGYHYQYVLAKDAKHVDQRVVRQTLPEAMEWLWKDYK